MSKVSIVEQLDTFFQELLEKAKGEKVDLETRVEVFKEGVRWAAVKNKIPEEGESTPAGGRLGKFKRGLRR